MFAGSMSLFETSMSTGGTLNSLCISYGDVAQGKGFPWKSHSLMPDV